MTERSEKPSRLPVARLEPAPTEPKLMMLRNMSFGAAGVCLVMLGIVFPRGVDEWPLRVSVYASAAGLPAWMTVGALFQLYIAVGPRSYRHFRGQFAQSLFGFLYLLGGCSLVLAVGGAIFALSPVAAGVLVAGMGSAFVLGAVFYRHLARWLADLPGDP